MVLDTVRVFNKHVLNPVMMLVAGQKYWFAGVIEHTGRRSGKKYSTPVVIDRVGDGFIIPLPYGTDGGLAPECTSRRGRHATSTWRDVPGRRTGDHRSGDGVSAVVTSRDSVSSVGSE